jgi:hypothetical protein
MLSSSVSSFTFPQMEPKLNLRDGVLDGVLDGLSVTSLGGAKNGTN